MAKPTEDSAAAIVSTKIGINWPRRSSRYTEEIRKTKLIDSKASSKDIIIVKIFFLFNVMPTIAVKNRINGKNKKKAKFIFFSTWKIALTLLII